MNLLYRALFYFKAKDLTKDILIYLLPETKINEKEVVNLSKKIENIQKIYDKVNWEEEPVLEKILLLIYQSKKIIYNKIIKKLKKLPLKLEKK